MIELVLSAALAGEPATVDLEWKGASAVLHVVPAADHHVSPDAFGDLHVKWPDGDLALSVAGDVAAAGFVVPDLRGRTIAGEIGVSICDNAGTTCRRVDLGFYGPVPDAKKGRITLLAKSVAAAEPTPPAAAPPARTADAAFAEAARRGELVLIDFGAVWCPPCNQLEVDVLYAADRDEVLAGYVLARVDVDDPSSWTLKDRYAVGGYPTIIAARPDGTEIGRMVGYDDRDSFVKWLADGKSGGLAARAARDPATVDPAEAALVALDLVRAGTGDPAPWLARAAPDAIATHLARMSSAASAEELRWLADHHAPVDDWAGDALDLAKADPALGAVLRAALASPAPDVNTAAERLELLGNLAAGDDAKALYGAAALAVGSTLTGDPAHDRPNYTWYADLRASSGDMDGAVAFLEQATAAFPDEPTFLLTEGRLLNDGSRPAEALAVAERALPRSWGDNRLRVAAVKCRALVALGRAAEAKTFADGVLAEVPAPPEGIDVRTTRYRDALAKAALPKAP